MKKECIEEMTTQTYTGELTQEQINSISGVKMKTAEELQEEFEMERQEKWWTNPVCHGETAFASWNYQNWLEHKIIKNDKEIRDKIEEIIRNLNETEYVSIETQNKEKCRFGENLLTELLTFIKEK